MGEGSCKRVPQGYNTRRHGWPAQGRATVTQPGGDIDRSAASSTPPPRAAPRATVPQYAGSYHIIALEGGGHHPASVFENVR